MYQSSRIKLSDQEYMYRRQSKTPEYMNKYAWLFFTHSTKCYNRQCFLSAWKKTKYWLLTVEKYHTFEWITISLKYACFTSVVRRRQLYWNRILRGPIRTSPHFSCVFDILFRDFYHHDLDTKDTTHIHVHMDITIHVRYI